MTSDNIFSGLKVVDFASFIAGPGAAVILSDFGADVIKVEPPTGDLQRIVYKVPPQPRSQDNYPWHLDNRNKRGLVLDLKSPEAVTVVERLVKWADVLIVNTPHPARKRLKLEYEDVAAWNPRLVYADLTGYGDKGPDAALPGFDITAYWARSGLLGLTRDAGASPTQPLAGSGDHATAVAVYAAILTGLYRREKTGKGSYVTTSLLANGVWSSSIAIQGALCDAKFFPLHDRLKPANAAFNLYQSSDEHWFMIVIGASWAAQYLARGFDVVATDPAPNAEANLRKYVDDAWQLLTVIGLSPSGSRNRLTFTSNMQEALSNADLVQENGPERPDFKMNLYAEMDAVTPVDSIIASSSSGITPSVMQSKCKHPERVLVGHPFNPPHIVPLVEVVGGTKTSTEAIAQAMAFYASIGKKPIHLKKELPGHVANRLQAALYREMLYLIEQNVLSVEDTDAAVCYGPGIRWGVMGQSLQWHLGGGAGGIKHFMDHLMDPLAGMMKVLGTPNITPELKQTIIDGVAREAAGRSVEELAANENRVMVGLLKLRAVGDGASSAAKHDAPTHEMAQATA